MDDLLDEVVDEFVEEGRAREDMARVARDALDVALDEYLSGKEPPVQLYAADRMRAAIRDLLRSDAPADRRPD